MRFALLVGCGVGTALMLAGCSGSTEGPGQDAAQASHEKHEHNHQGHDGHAEHAHGAAATHDSAAPSGSPHDAHPVQNAGGAVGQAGQGNSVQLAQHNAPVGSAAQATQAGGTFAADSPEALVKKLEASLKAADFEAWNEIYAAPYGPVLIKWNRAMDINNAQQQLANAMRARFPEQAPEQPVDFHQQMLDNLKQLESLEIINKVGEEDHVRMMIKVTVNQPGHDEPSTRVDSMLAIRQGNGWRLIPPMVEQQGIEVMQSMIAARSRLATRLQAIAQNVQAGKYQSLPEVEVAIQQAQTAMMQEIHPRMSQSHHPKSNVEDPFQRQ